MDDVLYTVLNNYFSTLSKLGYMSYNNVYNIIFLIAIEEFVYNDFDGIITEEDYRAIYNALYKVFGTTCAIPFPKHCNNMSTLHLTDISQLAYRVKKNEESIKEIENTKVIKPKDDSTQIEVNDITL